MEMDIRNHLTDAELFALAIPAAGTPAALPAHLSDCLGCSRALLEWKTAVGDLAADEGPIGRRSAEDWAQAEDRTLAMIRSHGAGHVTGSGRPSMRLRWAAAIAASILVAVLAAPLRRSADSRPAASHGTDLSAQDQADDRLLKDVARLSRGDDAGDDWDSLVPDPAGVRDMERL